ncbi:DUF721 domain-containing protein [Portibacter lacus]|nr:DUF721 domain-containing protein [Portibacter lacus]
MRKMQVKKNDMPIKDILSNFIKQNKITPGYYNAKVQQIWEAKMGPSVNKHTRSVILSKDQLYIKVDSAPLKNEFMLSKDKIIALLNKELGSEIIKKIFIN